MPHQKLRLAILAQDPRPHVQSAWDEIRESIISNPQIEMVSLSLPDSKDPDVQLIKADLAIVLGGDGALLRSCRMFGLHQLPFIGINLGRLGFLADLSTQEFIEHLPKFISRQFDVIEHLMYSCLLVTRKGKEELIGLNEVAICADSHLGMVDVELSIDSEHVTTYSGDGLIISTPVGSTAHSLSAGGPILRQDMKAFVVTPICAHTLTTRPVVDDADRVYKATLPENYSRENAILVVDGQIQRTLEPGDYIEIRQAPVSFKIARLPSQSFYNTLHRKLGWDGQPHYQKHYK